MFFRLTAIKAPSSDCRRLLGQFFLLPLLASLSYVHLLLEEVSGRLPMQAWSPSQPASRTDWQSMRGQQKVCSRKRYEVLFSFKPILYFMTLCFMDYTMLDLDTSIPRLRSQFLEEVTRHSPVMFHRHCPQPGSRTGHSRSHGS